MFILLPLSYTIVETARQLLYLTTLPQTVVDAQLYEVLSVAFIRPEIGLVIPGSVELEHWERAVAFVLFGMAKYIGLVSWALPGLVWCYGLAVREINQKLLKQVNDGGDASRNEVIEVMGGSILADVQYLLKPLLTLFVITAYASVAEELVALGDYDRVKRMQRILRLAMTMAILLTNASATAWVNNHIKRSVHH